ncbi:unnamed protein product, partial [Effrenium voratum]
MPGVIEDHSMEPTSKKPRNNMELRPKAKAAVGPRGNYEESSSEEEASWRSWGKGKPGKKEGEPAASKGAKAAAAKGKGATGAAAKGKGEGTKGDLNKGDLNKGDLNKGDLKGDKGDRKGDLKGDLKGDQKGDRKGDLKGDKGDHKGDHDKRKGDLDKQDLNNGDLGKGDRHKGDQKGDQKGDLSKGDRDLNKDDLSKGDRNKGDFGKDDRNKGEPNERECEPNTHHEQDVDSKAPAPPGLAPASQHAEVQTTAQETPRTAVSPAPATAQVLAACRIGSGRSGQTAELPSPVHQRQETSSLDRPRCSADWHEQRRWELAESWWDGYFCALNRVQAFGLPGGGRQLE